MSDSADSQQNPAEPSSAHDPSATEPVNGAVQPSGELSDTTVTAPQADSGSSRSSEEASSTESVVEAARSRKGLWAATAVLCVAGGTIGSILGARTVAHHDAGAARQAFDQSSAGIASSLKVAVQREEDLTVSASTFYAGNPRASRTEFARWAKWAHMLRHYPELDGLSLVTLVRAPQLADAQAQITGTVVKPIAGGSAQPRAGTLAPSPVGALPPSQSSSRASTLRIVPAGKRPYYCLSIAGLARSRADSAPPGLDYCSLTPTLLSSRDTAHSNSASTSAGGAEAVRVQTPVYRGGQPPLTIGGRRAAFVGWLSELLVPKVLVGEALRNHPANAVRLRYRTGHSAVALTIGAQQSGAQSTLVSFHNGWTARIFGRSADASVFADGKALMLLIGGILVSALLGLLVLLLGLGRARGRTPADRELPHDQLYDTLTGLPNRALTLDLCERMVARTRRQAGMLAGALVVDVDWFKDVNEKLGEACGDQLLKIVAERLESVVRAGDTVGRLDGDEFVVLVESAARGARLDSLARRMIEALHNPIELDGFGPSFFLTASVGVAFGQYAHPEDLLRDAQLALQAGKAAGKDRFTLFNANMRSVIEGQGALEAELNTALLDEQFFQLYQPIYDLGTRQVVGLEALIRWRHPTRGVLSAAEFVPLAEETGLIVPIGRWALEEACRRAAEWNVAGHSVGVSVQVSTNQLNRDGFITDVRRALQQSGIEPSKLTLEIGETTVLLDVAAATERCRDIKQLGVRIAIDDFGSGYAYRSDLQQMPIDFLKVDRSSLAASDDQDYRSWLLEAILHFGRDLSLTVIAKGIDTYEHMTTVQAMGCTLAQGFYMGEPTPAHVVEGLLDADFEISHAETAL